MLINNENVNNINSSTIITSLVWKTMERGGMQGIQLIVQVILARLLLPKDYGLIALTTIFIYIANVFIQTGFSTSLIQQKNVDDVDYSSAFYLSMIVAGVIYGILYFMAPFIAIFYKEPLLIPILRLLSLTVFPGAINSIQLAIVSRNLAFRMLFFSSLCGMIISGIFGIVLAYAGFGAWALVWQQITNQVLITLILWFTVKWRPMLLFSLERIKFLFSFGWKILCAALLDTIYVNLYGLIIGKIYNSQMLGFYNRGDQFPKLLVVVINGSVSSVLLPALSAHQDDKVRVKSMLRRSIVTSSFIIFPLMVGLAVVAETLVKIVLTDKWLPCVPFIQLLCVSYMFYPIHTANLQAINALGRSDIFLKLEIIKKVMGLIILFITIPFGIYIMLIGVVIMSLIATLINSYPNKMLLNYGYNEQVKDILPSLLLSFGLGLIVYSIQFIEFSKWLTLITQICSGVILYIMMAHLLKFECFAYLLLHAKNSNLRLVLSFLGAPNFRAKLTAPTQRNWGLVVMDCRTKIAVLLRLIGKLK